MKTIKQIADELGVNKQKVYRFIVKNHITASSEVKQSKLYDEAAERLIKSHFDRITTSCERSSEPHQKSGNEMLLEQLIKELEVKNEQLSEKDRQIREKDRQIVVGVAVGVGFLLFIGGEKLYSGYKEHFADQISLAELLISFAVVVFFAEPIREALPVNLLLLLLICHGACMGIRQYIKGWRRARGYY